MATMAIVEAFQFSGEIFCIEMSYLPLVFMYLRMRFLYGYTCNYTSCKLNIDMPNEYLLSFDPFKERSHTIPQLQILNMVSGASFITLLAIYQTFLIKGAANASSFRL